MKKTDELSIKKTFAFVKECYGDKKLNTGLDYITFCQKVGIRAEGIAHRLYHDMRPDCAVENKRDNIAAIVHCSLLCDVLNVSACAFEQVADITNVQVAAMVAAISRDFRLVETKRDMEFRGRLSQSSLGAQIVFVAKTICFAQSTDDFLGRDGLTAVSKIRKNIAQMDADLLSVTAANKYYVLRAHIHAARNLLSDIQQKIKTLKQTAKMEKIVLQNTKRLRESRETEEAEISQAANPKKRSRQYADKKRAVESDSD